MRQINVTLPNDAYELLKEIKKERRFRNLAETLEFLIKEAKERKE